jgi:hypothetical protein
VGEPYHEAEDDEWIDAAHRGHRIQCCDCGLVHNYDFRVVEGRVQFRAKRNNRATAAVKRHKRAPK